MTPAQFKHLRLLCGASQKRIGELLGVSENMVSLWERGSSPIKQMTAACVLMLTAERYGQRLAPQAALNCAANDELPDWVHERSSV